MPEGLKKSLDLSRYSYLLLCGEDKAAGFAIEADEFDNNTLLKWG